MKKFIVIQMKVESHKMGTILMSNIVRQVEADSKELAIGKFIVATQNITAEKKLDVECYDLSELNKA
jgi:hypothetical protein